jgi:phosphoribosylformylglycinamidine synthase
MAENNALVAVFAMAEKKTRAKKVVAVLSPATDAKNTVSESEISAVHAHGKKAHLAEESGIDAIHAQSKKIRVAKAGEDEIAAVHAGSRKIRAAEASKEEIAAAQAGRRKISAVAASDDEIESIHAAGAAAAKAEQKELDAAARANKADLMEIEAAAVSASAHSKSSRPVIAVLAGYGLNCEEETADALRMAGADAQIVHFCELEEKPAKLLKYQGFVIPGGWSFADDIASGRVLANKLKHRLGQSFLSFVKSGRPVLGICNGFQVLVTLGAIPDLEGTMAQETTLVTNRQGRFENRWVTLRVEDSVCPFLKGIKFIRAPVRHGEGQFIVRDQAVLADLRKSRMIALRYCDEKLHTGAGYPLNPNGSLDDIAGICNHKGNVLAFMPHPECSVRRELWPNWTRGETHEANSLKLFENFVKKAAEYI